MSGSFVPSECPITKYMILKVVIKKFINNNKKIPKELLSEIKTYKNEIKQNKSEKWLQCHEETCMNQLENDTSFKKYFKEVYNRYRHQDKYLGDEQIKTTKVINDIGDNGDSIDKYIPIFMATKRDGLCWSYHPEHKKLVWMNKENLNYNFKSLRKEYKLGKIKCDEKNHREFILNNKSVWYSLTLQHPTECMGLDLAGLKLFSHLVDGHMFFFSSKSNRDSMYNYLIK